MPPPPPPPPPSPNYLITKYMTLALINENITRKFGSYYFDPPTYLLPIDMGLHKWHHLLNN